MKLAFKGTDGNMNCRGTQFQLGITFSKSSLFDEPRLCSSDGFHYCQDLRHVFGFYPNHRGDSRFFIVEILGRYSEDDVKGITTSFRFIREITDVARKPEEIHKVITEEIENYHEKKQKRDEGEAGIREEIRIQKEKEEARKKMRDEILTELKEEKEKTAQDKEKEFERVLSLNIVRKIQEANPLAIIGGSAALYLHGNRISRWINNQSDLDIIIPYYFPLQSTDLVIGEIEDDSKGFSGSDFTYCLSCYNSDLSREVKVDVRIDPHSKYTIINHNGFDYKVNNLENIWKAKLSYNKTKHVNDLKEATCNLS